MKARMMYPSLIRSEFSQLQYAAFLRLIVETPEGAVLTRQGSVTGRMDFSPGERNTFLYETPYGSSTVGMETKRYASTLTERGGTLEIEYVIDFDHAFVALNQMHIQVTEKKEY